MSAEGRRNQPRTFFLNEIHELSPEQKEGGGRAPEYAGISWAAKASQIGSSIRNVLKSVATSRDPLRKERYFILAQPVPEVEKKSKDKRKAPDGTYKELTDFGGQHARIFDRLGLDLLQVTTEGHAVVHASADRINQILERSESLESVGPREQSRWVTIQSFATVPLQLRVDADWLRSLRKDIAADSIIELQPVLGRLEADQVLRGIAELISELNGGKLTGTGTDFSGRHWFRGSVAPQALRTIARDFYSVQSIHAPLVSIAAGGIGKEAKISTTSKVASASAAAGIADLPCVAILDLGVPSDHRRLGPYRRGQFVPIDAPRPPIGDHGSFVASRIVFGDHDSPDDLERAAGECSFYDAIVAEYPGVGGASNRVNDKLVMEALRGVRGASPDVRVFNLSFGDSRPLSAFQSVERREKRLLMQDLDNFVFATDSVIVVAAGNSSEGVVPNAPYPDHHSDARWALGPWACGFSTLICGSFAPRISSNGLAPLGWPSPFSRVGPGICDSPVPFFGAPGGNTDDQFRQLPGLGVWGFSARGLPEDRVGTSYSAPILAREAALALQALQSYCIGGAQPYASLVRAFLALVSQPTVDLQRVQPLARLTLGYGFPETARLTRPNSGSAVILWQGSIESANDIVRIQLPIPRDWLREAEKPVLRLIVTYDPPVNEVAHATWACRRVRPFLHPGPDVRAVNAPHGAHPSYPFIDRRYSLARFRPGEEKEAQGDMWLVELSYEEIAPYPPGMQFDARQRVAFVAELTDESEEPVDPQPAMQALPIASSMTRLSVAAAQVRTPVIIRAR